ncbi:MAG TPA: ABC transporter ATP-binding protein [Actinomycetaceae bacterium]|nr:ABC transporter ATP-binding protein [Actinomycetaceae bacterium]
MTAAAELVHISKSYGRREVLTEFDFELKAGEMVAVTGPSGSGKSTLLNLVGLLERPDRGQVRLFGADAPMPRTARSTRYLRHHFGYLFQNFALVEDATVEQNLEIALAYVHRRSPRKNLIREALEQVGLGGSENQKAFTLSGGEQQRVAIARLLLKPCDIILADEPTGALDPDNRDSVLGLLRELNQRGKSILIATHDPAVENSCVRTVHLDSPRRVSQTP